MNAPANSSRRDFIRACIRYPAILGMAALGITLVTRSRSSTGCQQFPVCQSCKLLPNCEKPQALDTRNAC